MIKARRVVTEAKCDSCGDDLLSTEEGLGPQAHYGKLEHHFGYGHELDRVPPEKTEWEICGECWRAVFIILKLSLKPGDKVQMLAPRGSTSEDRKQTSEGN